VEVNSVWRNWEEVRRDMWAEAMPGLSSKGVGEQELNLPVFAMCPRGNHRDDDISFYHDILNVH
jgi:hypothetical protein